MPRSLPLLTTSRLSCYRRCPAEHHYRYVLGRVPPDKSAALRLGSLVHLGLEAWWTYLFPGQRCNYSQVDIALHAMRAAPDVDPYELAKAEAMLIGYDARWGDAGYTALAVEAEFRAPLTYGQRVSAAWQRAGKLDVVARDPAGRVVLVEHKTSSEDISAGSPYWARLRLDGQVSLYFAGAAALGYEVEACVYDVLFKPAQKPLKKSASPKLRKDGQPYAGQRLQDETPDEYRARILVDIAEHPERYYARGEVVRLEREPLRHDMETWHTARLMADLDAPVLRNVDACVRYGSVCGYFPVCSGERRIEDYEQLSWVHPELTEET